MVRAAGGYDAPMTEPDDRLAEMRAGLIESLRACRATERAVFAAFDPIDRDAPAADGGWSPKDIQAHLSAWKRRQVRRLAALREGREEPGLASTETDEINAVFHAERADWRWDQVVADADMETDDLIIEVGAATAATLESDRVALSILGNGADHAMMHLPAIAAQVGLDGRVVELADAVAAIVDRGGWPSQPAAFARYNLACFHALGGRLDAARALLRQALPEQEELRTWAPQDDDLIPLRAELASLAGAGTDR